MGLRVNGTLVWEMINNKLQLVEWVCKIGNWNKNGKLKNRKLTMGSWKWETRIENYEMRTKKLKIEEFGTILKMDKITSNANGKVN